MNIANGILRLDTLDAERIDTENLCAAWNELSRSSVEVISAGTPDVWTFADNHALSFFVIQHIVNPEASEGDPNTPVCLLKEPLTDGFNSHETIGLVYFSESSTSFTVNIGLVLLPEARKRSFGRQAAQLALTWVFDELHCHRVQAQIIDVDSQSREISLGLFTGLGFSHEGTARYAIFCPNTTTVAEAQWGQTAGEWKDVLHLAMLDTDWVCRKNVPRMSREVMRSRWDDLFARQERERQEMLRLEEWEERKRAAAKLPAEPAGSMRPVHLEDAWETSSQISVQWPKKWGDTPLSAEGDRRFEDHHLPSVLDNHFVLDNWRLDVANSASLSSLAPTTGLVIHPRDTPSSNAPTPEQASGSTDVEASSGRKRRRQAEEDGWESLSLRSQDTYSSAASEGYSDAESNPFSDVNDVPRSPSVSPSIASNDTWDGLETSSASSFDILTDRE